MKPLNGCFFFLCLIFCVWQAYLKEKYCQDWSNITMVNTQNSTWMHEIHRKRKEASERRKKTHENNKCAPIVLHHSKIVFGTCVCECVSVLVCECLGSSNDIEIYSFIYLWYGALRTNWRSKLYMIMELADFSVGFHMKFPMRFLFFYHSRMQCKILSNEQK